MASLRPYVVIPIGGLKPSDHRGIVFLGRDGDADLDAAKAFAALKPKHKRELLVRFDFWIGGGVHDKYFHGWPNNARYKRCFVSKWRQNNQNHRLYGFLCHPQPKTRPRFQLCVLVSHATKNAWETDPSELDGANELVVDPDVIAAIEKAFPDAKAGEKRWIN